MSGKRGIENMADMNDYMQAIIKALQFIHIDNVMMLAVLTNSDPNCDEAKEMVKSFNKAIEGVLEK